MGIGSKVMDQIAYHIPPAYDRNKPSYSYGDAKKFLDDPAHKKEIEGVYDAAQKAGIDIMGMGPDMMCVNPKTREYKMGAFFVVEHWRDKKTLENLAKEPMGSTPFRVEVRPPAHLCSGSCDCG